MVEHVKYPELLAVNGVRLSACSAKINKKKSRLDLALIEIIPESNTVAVFTKNSFCAAPVTLAKQHLEQEDPELLLINSGNANAGTGQQGLADALNCCKCLSQHSNKPLNTVLPFSTGVIGEPLPVENICAVIPELYDSLSTDNWLEVSQAIMTTDTVVKGISNTVIVDGKTITITGIAKGSGMIKPDMATMLAFIFTDADIEKTTLQKLLNITVNQTFNCISIDGDTSTNDACVLVATGAAGNKTINETSIDIENFESALLSVCTHLSHAIVKDGEGATKFVKIIINGGTDQQECRLVAESIAHSLLVKTALFASDPNWGRILAALGRAGLTDLEIDKIQIYLGTVCIVDNGSRAETYTETAGRAVFEKDEIEIRVELNRGNSQIEFWTCDLSYDYVRINAEYRT